MIKSFNRPKIQRAYRAPWYDTVRWRNERKSYLSDNPLCVHCKAEGRIKAATILDHKDPISKQPEHMREQMFWDKNNWQGLCKSHHESKSAKEK